ncbi:claudin-34 [Nothobranchius furzeri]|nr:claudin-34 [Nothobranchius furzeri]XP_015831035.1 claudin-34 [Nothobranchius furzeri]KAF7205026.1 transcript variant X2 [Nothobranchius furzeri]KAF7205027.1 transcript variant X1 [Nothobranchius furzeri]
MIYVAHTAHWQFLGLITGFVAWILTMATAGINEWRLWYVADVSVITSGVAWVGIWRACFYSHVLPRTENCQSISILDTFVPAEIHLAQVLMMLAVISGLVGNVSAAVAMRMAYFSVENRSNIRMVFVMTGVLYLLTATISLVPLVWNMTSVLNNSTIDFPPEFYLPVAPVRQSVGSAIGMGIFASILMLISGLLFLCYRYVRQAPEQRRDPLSGPWTVTTLTKNSEPSRDGSTGMDNYAFHSGEGS